MSKEMRSLKRQLKLNEHYNNSKFQGIFTFKGGKYIWILLFILILSVTVSFSMFFSFSEQSYNNFAYQEKLNNLRGLKNDDFINEVKTRPTLNLPVSSKHKHVPKPQKKPPIPHRVKGKPNKGPQSHFEENLSSLYMIPNENSMLFGINDSICNNSEINKKNSHKIDKVLKENKIRFISSKEELIECIKYYFYDRNTYMIQDYHDNEALKLNLELISRQLCFTTWNDISLEYFSELTLTRKYTKMNKQTLKYFKPNEFLNKIQNTSFCDIIPSIYIPTIDDFGTGFGSRLIWFTHALSISFTQRTPKSRIMMTQKNSWPFAKGGDCKTNDHRCFFKIFSNCYINKVKGNGKIPEWSEESNELVVKPKILHDGIYPLKYEKRGIFWFQSQISYFLFQPSLRVTNDINFIKEKYNTKIEPNMVTLHIRRGDKYKEGKLFKFESYLLAIRKLENSLKTEIKTIFFITDDLNVENEIKKYQNLGVYNFFSVNSPSKGSNTGITSINRIKTGKLNGYKEAISMLEGLYLSLEGMYFVGTLNSNFGRMFFKLMSAKQNRIVDHISLNQWSYDVSLSFWTNDWGNYGCEIIDF